MKLEQILSQSQKSSLRLIFSIIHLNSCHFQSAQRRIRAMILSTNPPPAPKKSQKPAKDSSPSGSASTQQTPPQQQQPTPQSSQ